MAKRKRTSIFPDFVGMADEDDEVNDPTLSEAEALADELPGDHTFGTHQQRPAWRKGRYEQLWRENWSANGNQLICALCSQKIMLTANSPAGLEVYGPKQAYKEQTRPHIDHFSPDWIDRAATIEQILRHANPSLTAQQEKKLLNWAFNARQLRIVHRKCNLSRPKAGGAPNLAFQTKTNKKPRF